MSPFRAAVDAAWARFPRVSGDEPESYEASVTFPRFSPRERG